MKYQIKINWEASEKSQTTAYTHYSRAHMGEAAQKTPIDLSADPFFRGDHGRYNPEELLIMSLASCHMLWFLHLCADRKIEVLSYTDAAGGELEQYADGSGKMRSVTLYPLVRIKEEKYFDDIDALHAQAAKMCFIANSCNFPIDHFPETRVGFS